MNVKEQMPRSSWEADIKMKKGHASVKAIDVNSIDAHLVLLSFSSNRESVWVPVTTEAQQNAIMQTVQRTQKGKVRFY